MNNVRKHIDKQFAKYPKTDETLELKEEVVSNVEAEIEDLQCRGHSLEEAFRISLGKMAKLDELIDGVKTVRISGVMIEMMQWTLIYTLVAWILTITLSEFYSMRRASWILFLLVIVIGISYLVSYLTLGYLSKKRVGINLFKLAAFRKYVWIIWFVLVLAKWGMTTAMLFGSDIWFSRPISINGPYEFASISLMYATPIMTVIVPLLMNKLQKIIVKQGEVNVDEE